MTPGARISAAIAVLDLAIAGASAEKALTNWARASRFAGSGDRAAVRDLVFDALRCLRSAAALGGAMNGRGVILGRLRSHGIDPETLFTGIGHAPTPVLPTETGRPPQGFEAWDIPDWLGPVFNESLGPRAQEVALSLRDRAPVFLRANLARVTRAQVQAALACEGIETRAHTLAQSALEVMTGGRKVAALRPYLDGLVELQDAASQAVVEALPLSDGMRVLDYCAGGGGKALAMAARAQLSLFVHDVSEARMRDIPLRAARAGTRLEIVAPGKAKGGHDLVLVDAPCSGSGAWRRSPEAKWRLTSERLEDLRALQSEVLSRASGLTTPNGMLAYVTCSLFEVENGVTIKNFLNQTPGWKEIHRRRLTPLDGGDGFFLSILKRE